MRISAATFALVLIGSLIIGLGLPGPATPAQMSGPGGGNALVVPGVSVGPLRLGMQVADVERLLGTPPMPVEKKTVADSTWEEWYFLPRTDVDVFAKDSAIVQIVVGAGTPDTRGCATREGIRLGSPASALRAAYGAPDGASTLRNQDGSQIMADWVYDKRGLRVFLDSVNRVLALEIFSPGTFCSLQESLKAGGWPGADCATLTPPLSTAAPAPSSQPGPTPGISPPSIPGRIAFVSDRDGSDQIYVASAGGVARLTSPPGTSWSPAFSPDGQKVVFNSGHRPGPALDPSDWQIYVMDVDSSSATRLTFPPGMNLAPRFSPDGRTIGFTSSRDGLFQIYTMDADGSHVIRRTSPPGASIGPSFSPDDGGSPFNPIARGPFKSTL